MCLKDLKRINATHKMRCSIEKMGQLQIKNWADLLGALDSKDFNDEYSSKEETTEYEGRTEDGPQEIMLNLENKIEKLKDHGLDLIIEGETPM
jgi:hypothetical protein